MARKGQFKKGGGRVGDGRASSHHRKSKSRTSTAIVVVPRAAPTHKRRSSGHRVAKPAPRKHHRRHGRHGVTVGKVIASAIVLGSVAGTNSGPLGARAYDIVQKIPGAKTFGGAAVAGLGLGALYKFTRFGGRFRPWMAAAGLVGVVAAGLKIGEQGTSFKWLGDARDSIMDVED